MFEFDLFLILFTIVSIIALIFKNSPLPLSLFLLCTGMLLSFIPELPRMSFNPNLVLNIFLPLLIYEMTFETGWRDVKFNLKPILLLSVGQVIFITILVACAVHFILPELGWPVAFIIGAVVSPPDDVAVMPLIEKGYLPKRVVTLLKSEALFNDSIALILFRFSLVALLTSSFSFINASIDFTLIIIGETLYGIFLGYALGYLRTKIQESRIQMITSVVSPFLAYLPAVHFGGCGVLATAMMGIVLRHRFLSQFSPENRVVSRAIWSSLSFAIQGILFLLVGLDLHFVRIGIASIPMIDLMFYASIVILTVIVGRFLWIYPTLRFSRPPASWECCFILSWTGMRGAISLAAVLAVPHLNLQVAGANVRDLIIFLVFCVIFATLVFQGMTLPWLLNKLKISSRKIEESKEESLQEWTARIRLSQGVLAWLTEYKQTLPPNHPLLPEVKFYLRRYQITLNQYKENIKGIITSQEDLQSEIDREGLLLRNKIIEIERSELSRLWDQDEISNALRNKLMLELDYRTQL